MEKNMGTQMELMDNLFSKGDVHLLKQEFGIFFILDIQKNFAKVLKNFFWRDE